MLDMGTKVQFESYLPRYYPTRNLNEDTSSSQSRYYEDEAFNRQLFIDFKPTPTNGYSEYDKETLKRTMLEHEAIFKKQVYELHRLYQVQKDMMDVFCRKESDKFKASMFTSQMPPEFGERALYSTHPSSVRNHYDAVNVADTDDKKSAINFLKEVSMQHIPTSTDNDQYFKNGRLMDSNPKICKRTFDLHLPADVYIGGDDSEMTKKQNPEPCVSNVDLLNLNSDFAPESEINLTLETVNFHSCSEDKQRSNKQQTRDCTFRALADLNEPSYALYDEGTSDSGSCMPNTIKFHSENSQTNPNPKSNSILLQKDFITGRVKDEGTCSSNFGVDKEEHRRHWPLFHVSENYPMSSETIQLRLKKTHESHLPEKNKNDILFGFNVSGIDETPGRNLDVPKLNYSGHSAEETISKLSYVLPSMNPTSVSMPYSSWKNSGNINHLPIAVQALHCFTDHSNSQSSVIQNQTNGCVRMQSNGNLQAHNGNGSQSTYYANSFKNGFPFETKSSSLMHFLPNNIDKPNLNEDGANSTYENSGGVPQKYLKSSQCTDIKCAKDLDMNSEMLNTIKFGHTAQEKLNEKHDGLNALHWFKKPATFGNSHDKEYDPQVDPDFVKSYAQQVCNSGKVAHNLSMEEKDRGISICALPNSISSFKLECRNQRYEISHNPKNKEIISFSLNDKVPQSFSHTHAPQYQEQLLTDNQKCALKGKGARSCNTAIRKDINLNSSVITHDDSYFTGITVTDKEFPLTASLACNTGNLTCKIDLEAPVEVEHNMTHLGEPVHFPHKDKFYLYETLRVAASTVVSLSKDAHNLVGVVSGLLAPASCDSLRWFAEVVTSNIDTTGDCSVKETDGNKVSDEDEPDSFESMTLKLKELKEDEYWCRSYNYEIPQDEDKLTTSLLFTKTRRGQQRKRRQRKDFQRDILPAIASLSRQEVAEDLYSLVGLPKSSSKSRNTSSGRRGTCRNSQTRGRKSGSFNVTIAEVHVSPLPVQPTPNDLEIEGSIKGWGRTTRRCRRQRTQIIPV